jgi:hypothetical protein
MPVQVVEKISQQTPTMKGRNLPIHDRNIVDAKNNLHQKFSSVSYLKQRNNELNRISDNIHNLYYVIHIILTYNASCQTMQYKGTMVLCTCFANNATNPATFLSCWQYNQ